MEIEEKIREEISLFLKTKPKNRVYLIRHQSEEYSGDFLRYSKFEPEELESLRQVIEKYGMENINEHLEEVIEDEDYRSDLFPEYITEIDLDTEYNAYQFTMHYMKRDGSLHSRKIVVEWLLKDYARLLELCVADPGMNFNKLKFADEEIYNKLLRDTDCYNVEEGYFFVCTEPYLITMDEVKADADEIRKKFPELELKNGYTGYYYR